MPSAMVGAGLKGGYLVNPMLAQVHWQAGETAEATDEKSLGCRAASGMIMAWPS
jgi:hypothetical protein